MFKITSLLVVALALVALTGCGDNKPASSTRQTVQPDVHAMTTDVSIKLGETGPSFAKRYPGSARVTHSTPNVDFYQIDWEQRAPGQVRVEHGKHSFVIEDALGVQAPQELGDFKAEGLYNYTIFAGVSASDLIPHDEARLKTYAILKRIVDVGWKTTTPRSRPRLKGQARLDYVLDASSSVGLDPRQIPTFEEWMRIESHTPWSFYADGLYMEVSFTRERTLTDPTKPGSYLLTFNIKTETEYFRGFAGPDNRLRWKEVLPQELAKVAVTRAQKETELRAKGVPIDESYQDPPVPALK